MGRPAGQATAPAALRDAGLTDVFGHDALTEDVVAPPPAPERRGGEGYLNEAALLEMVGSLYRRTASAFAAGRFPIVYGADCAVLLATVPALRDATGASGLLHVDAHEDATPMALSRSGEAANMEVRLLTGLDGERPAAPMPVALPAVGCEAVAMLGPRDREYRAELGVASVEGRIFVRSADEVMSEPRQAAGEALRHLAAATASWWLHVDFDVLRHEDFSACGAPGEPKLAGGLSWEALTTIVSAALRAPGCRGWSLAVYNPDADPDRSAAARIVRFLADVSE